MIVLRTRALATVTRECREADTCSPFLFGNQNMK